MNPADDSGVSATDHITNVNQLNFSGTGSDENIVVLSNWGSLQNETNSQIAGGTFQTSISLPEGNHHIAARQIDVAGNYSPESNVLEIIVDNSPPATSVSPADDLFNTVQNIELTCNDSSGLSCYKTYFTLDGSDPSTTSSTYSDPIPIEISTVIKYFSADIAGNIGSVQEKSITIDLSPPDLTISEPVNGVTQNKVFLITGSVSDKTTQVESLQLQVTDGEWYLNQDEKFVENPVWIFILPDSEWSFVTSSVNWQKGTAYDITAKSTDTAGNTRTQTIRFTFDDPKSDSSISCQVSDGDVIVGQPLYISGSITPAPGQSGTFVDLQFTPPAGQIISLR